MNNWTSWQLITHYLVKIVSLGLILGRCANCGNWMKIDMIVPSVSGAVCYNCDFGYNQEDLK